MATLTGKLRDRRDGIQSSRRGDPHTPPASGSAGREGKKKRRNTTKEKNKPTCEQKKRGHPSTPSHSDDSEKHQTQQSINMEKSSDLLHHAKSHAKEKSARKCRKSKSAQTAVEESSAPDKVDKVEVSSQTQESLRWEGVLDDPVAEAERLEVYKANRRKRYMTFKQTLLENAKLVLGSESDMNNLGRTCKPGSPTIM